MSTHKWKSFKVALIQLSVEKIKSNNLNRASAKIAEAAKNDSKIVVLPECFNSPYGTNFFSEYAESIKGESAKMLSNAAKDNNVFLIGGSFPERENDKLYNTCTVWGPDGALIAKHRKVHLFDINIPGGVTFKESETLSAGNSLTYFEIPGARIGVGICYDIRFAEMAQIYANLGCSLLVYPGAFNMSTGPAHWELLQRARAVDNQVFVATVSPARNTSSSYIAWGHSSLVNPWGEVVATTQEQEDIVYGEIDLEFLNKVRTMVPITSQRRLDVYEAPRERNEN